jgi:hypothetical protein
VDKLNIHPAIQAIWPDTAWGHVTDQLVSKFHDPQAKTLFINAIEDLFFFQAKGYNKNFSPTPEIFQSFDSWVGVSHQHRMFLNDKPYIDHVMFGEGSYKVTGERVWGVKGAREWSYFQKSMDKCKCLITLSQYMESHWKKRFPELNVINLYHPVAKRQHVFNLEKFKRNRHVRCLGTWGRDYTVWDELKTDYSKSSSRDNYLSHDEYHLMFTDTVIFLDVEDASANNAVVECIQRNTPILTRQHPAVVEYLGTDYPLYFDNLEHASSLLSNIDNITQAYMYLQHMDKQHIQIETFIHNFSNIFI